MKTIGIALTMVLAAACSRGPKQAAINPEASARFRAAWEKRQAGDEAAFQSAMKELAARYPDTRVGQRAREELAAARGSNGPMMGAAAAGVMAAVAVPAFMKYRARAAESASRTRPDAWGPVGIRAGAAAAGPPSKPVSKRGWDPLK